MAIKSVPPLVARAKRQRLRSARLYNPAKNSNEKGIRSDLKTGQYVGKNTGENDHKTGVYCEFFAYIDKAYKGRRCV